MLFSDASRRDFITSCKITEAEFRLFAYHSVLSEVDTG